MPGDEFSVLELSVHLLGGLVGQPVALTVRLVHAFQEPNRFPDRIEVLGWDVLGPDSELLELADRGEDFVADGSDVRQEPLVRGRHKGDSTAAAASRARDLARQRRIPHSPSLLGLAGELVRKPPRYAAVSDAGFS
jgi:hypothetical protein